MIIFWLRVVIEYVVFGYVLKVELIRFIDRVDVGYGNKKYIFNYCVLMVMCF